METRTISRKKKWKILLNIYLLMGFSIYIVPLTPVKIMLAVLTAFQTIFLFFFIDEPESDRLVKKKGSTHRSK